MPGLQSDTLSCEKLYDEMKAAYKAVRVLEKALKSASDQGHNALEAIRASHLSRAYQKTQMLATMYLVQLDREHELT